MDEMLEKRFGYLKELNDEDLLNKKQELINELAFLDEQINDPTTTSELRSELLNSDLKYARDKFEYVNYLVKERNLSDKTK